MPVRWWDLHARTYISVLRALGGRRLIYVPGPLAETVTTQVAWSEGAGRAGRDLRDQPGTAHPTEPG